ncbi:MAG: type II toxin-antitoxin system VapC family toxin [Candidatus Dojkabacteria bacterium]
MGIRLISVRTSQNCYIYGTNGPMFPKRTLNLGILRLSVFRRMRVSSSEINLAEKGSMPIELSGSWAIDTNILIYSLDEDSVHFKKMKSFWRDIWGRQDIQLAIADQVLTESHNVLSKIYHIKHQEIADLLQEFMQTLPIVRIKPRTNTFGHFLNKIVEQQSVDVFDAYLAATLLDNRIDGLVTANTRHFKDIAGLELFDPTR